MPELEIVKSLLQMGAAGILIIAGWGMLRFLREERTDRASERKSWFDRMDSIAEKLETLTEQITTALAEAREGRAFRCPFTGANQAAIEEFERRLEERMQERTERRHGNF